jgi:leukotriene-A4 hydrolase
MQALRPVLRRHTRPSLFASLPSTRRSISCAHTSRSTQSYHRPVQLQSHTIVRNMSTSKWTPPAPGDIPAPPVAPPHDIHSYANLLEIKPKHIDIDWTVDWDKRLIFGTVTHTVTVTKDGVDQIILDTSYLDIKKVTAAGSDLKWSMGKRKVGLGSPLIIELGSTKKGQEIDIAIEYSTTEQCTTLGWLTAEQTESKKSPFLYSQAQAIHARSMLPCIDSPSHKITYTAKVKSEVPILMSALADGSVRATESVPGDAFLKDEGIYRFRQPVGVPTYLIAIVGGILEFRALAPRVGVWAEPAMIERAEWEFKKDAPRFLEAAEQTISPYSWTRYDSVVLPPSFPYGGMENANLTTLTPSLICGDRSQTDVLLHELAHSWSGNLTSCGNWSSFWLNEGINVWIERVLVQVVNGPEFGPAARGFSYIIGAKALNDALKQFESIKRFQRLVPEFKDGEDPDDAFSSIPYEKGSNLILYLERLVGGLDVFLPFIRSHFTTFYDRSVTTDEWKQHLFDFYAGNKEITKKLEDVDWQAWLYGEGLELPVKMEYDNTLAIQSQKLADRWIKVIEGRTSAKSEKFGMDDIQGWDSNQVVVFIQALHSGPKLSSELAEEFDKTYNFSTSTNPEIRLRFYEVALEDVKTKYKDEAAEWVAKQGRMKYCRVLYRALNKVDPELAKTTFTKNRSFYHPIAAAMIASVSVVREVRHKGLPAHFCCRLCRILVSDLQCPFSYPLFNQCHYLSLLQLQDLNIASKDDSSQCLIAVCGSTGTGKSQLAVEIAQHLGESEIISADSMQIYQGLDVITNKVTSEETQGIPHHLMSFLDPKKDAEYDVGSFIRDAGKIIEKMKQDGKMPIIVGGTTYYIQHLLLPGRLISTRAEEDDEEAQGHNLSRQEVEAIANKASSAPLNTGQLDLLHQILDLSHSSKDVQAESIEVWKLLQSLDEEMASRWHFKDTRKIIRSIKVLFETGRRHSELINEQNKVTSQDRANGSVESESARVLIFSIECDRLVLLERLDSRVEKMIDVSVADLFWRQRLITATEWIATRDTRPTHHCS